MSSGFELFAVSEAGLAVERSRLDAAATNIANAQTNAAVGGRLYQPIRVLATLPSSTEFSNVLDGSRQDWSPVAELVEMDVPPRRVLEPGHPAADASGFVEYPGIDATQEMIILMTAVRAYEANLKAATRTMVARAIEIGAN